MDCMLQIKPSWEAASETQWIKLNLNCNFWVIETKSWKWTLFCCSATVCSQLSWTLATWRVINFHTLGISWPLVFSAPPGNRCFWNLFPVSPMQLSERRCMSLLCLYSWFSPSLCWIQRRIDPCSNDCFQNCFLACSAAWCKFYAGFYGSQVKVIKATLFVVDPEPIHVFEGWQRDVVAVIGGTMTAVLDQWQCLISWWSRWLHLLMMVIMLLRHSVGWASSSAPDAATIAAPGPSAMMSVESAVLFEAVFGFDGDIFAISDFIFEVWRMMWHVQ